MSRLAARLPLAGLIVQQTLIHVLAPTSPWLGLALVVVVVACLAALWHGETREALSPLDKTFVLYLALAALGWWLAPASLGRVMRTFAMPVLYLLLLATALLPLVLGRPLFTEFFARRRTPEAVRGTDIYRAINRHMTLVWAGIFAACGLGALLPHLASGLAGPGVRLIFELALPAALLVGVGLPFTQKYPDHYQRRLGITPLGTPPGEEASASTPAGPPLPKEKTMANSGAQAAKNCRELLEMMPLAFNASTAGDMKATIQFEVSGDEDFTAHLVIADGKCAFNQGPAASPDLTVKTPADVWLAVSRGEKDGAAAFMGGQFKAEGNLGVLMQMNSLFSAA